MQLKFLLALAAVGLVCFLGGNLTGFFLGVWSTEAGGEFLSDVLSDEEPADVQRPRKLAREGFRLSYPYNWRIDSGDEAYDPDHLFSIESPGSSFTLFVILDASLDPQVQVAEQVEQFKKLVSVTDQTPLTRWGKYEGEGVHLQGRLLGMKGGVRIFSYSSPTRSFVAVSQYFDEDLEHVEPGFDLIENSFELHE